MSYQVDGPTAKGFFRLIRSDQTAADLDTADFDGDDLSNLYEITPRPRPGGINGHAGLNPNIQTNLLLADTDGDSLNDKWEEDHGLDPTDNGSRDLNNSPTGDSDGDGLTNAQELFLGTNLQDTDTDGDGVADGIEVEAGTDPKNPAEFPVQVVSISKRSYGYSRKNPADPLPYGVFRWGANWFDDNHEDLSSNLDASPSNLLSKITDIIFPALPPAQIWHGHGDGQASLVGKSDIANSIFYWKTKSTPIWYPNSPISTGLIGDITIQRIWLKAPISTHEQKFDFLRQKAKSTFDDDLWVKTNEIISTEAVTMVIPAGQTYSASLDFQPIPAIVEGYSMTSNASDSLLLMEVGVDSDRDGEITFDVKAKTTAEKPYRFWINNDQDDVEADEPTIVDVNDRDLLDSTIKTSRDLEDFSRIKISVGIPLNQLQEGKLKIGLKFKESTTASPAIRIWPNESDTGSRDYLTDAAAAGRQRSKTLIGDTLNGTTFIPKSYWLGRSDSQANLIFEGVKKGEGELILVVQPEGASAEIESASIHLNLLDVREMY